MTQGNILYVKNTPYSWPPSAVSASEGGPSAIWALRHFLRDRRPGGECKEARDFEGFASVILLGLLLLVAELLTELPRGLHYLIDELYG